MIFLGVNIGHGASAALMINGKIILTFQEERFNNIKNFVGYPKKSIQECLDYVKKNNLTILDIENNYDFCMIDTKFIYQQIYQRMQSLRLKF